MNKKHLTYSASIGNTHKFGIFYEFLTKGQKIYSMPEWRADVMWFR